MVKDRPIANHDWERPWWEAGYRRVAGVDEVGRGAIAGPLVAAAVILPLCARDHEPLLAGLAESKVQSHEQRVRWVDRIRQVAVGIGIGIVPCDELDAIGLGPANRIAMERAVYALPLSPDVVLIDAAVTELSVPQSGIIDGDAVCLSIAAASVIAKVHRDQLMCQFHEIDLRYGFAIHKGYGTPMHLRALTEHGPCDLHRKCFAPIAALIESR